MRFETFIAMKHLVKGRRHGFVSLISIISIAGVAVGVMALIVVLAVMSGFDRELKEKIVGVQPHLILEAPGGITDLDGTRQAIESLQLGEIVSIAPFVQGQGLVRSERAAIGVAIKGIDPRREVLAIFEKHLQDGTLEFQDLSLEPEPGKTQIAHRAVMGEELARSLGVGLGDAVTLIAPVLEEDLAKALKRARSESFVVSGIFRVGMSDFDSGFVLIGLERAQKLYGLGSRVSGMSIRLNHAELADRLKSPIRGRFGSNYSVRTWMDLNRTFFSALQVEKTVMTILLSLIVLVAAFNIISTLTMVVMEKTKDIGVLMALGATRGEVRRIFLLQGFLVGSIGIGIGAASGLALAFNLNPVSDFLKETFGISVFPSDIYYFDRIPAQVNSSDVLVITLLALLLSLLAGFYPAYRASRLDPVQALRYE